MTFDMKLYQHKWYLRNKDRLREKARGTYKTETYRTRKRSYREGNREHLRAYFRAYQKKRDFGISENEYYNLFSKQNWKCFLCDKPAIVLDHNHNTKEIRAFLCIMCNRGIAFLEDKEWLHRALFYLGNYGTEVL